MPTVKGTFRGIVLAKQEHATDDEMFVCQVHFSIDGTDGLFHCDMKQTIGSRFDSDPVEVGPPQVGYTGPWRHAVFSSLAERYYRDAFGPTGWAMKVQDCSNIRLVAGHFFRDEHFEFEASEHEVSW